jgi:hypothetical protein
MSHSGPFQPSSQWHRPPPYFPWFEHRTGQTPAQIRNAICTTRSEKHLWSLVKIWDFHGSDYEEWHLLGCYAMWLL